MDITVDDVTIEKLDTHSAVPTWIGFDYQGQVSIYWMMKQLNQMNLSCNLEIERAFQIW